MPDRKLYSGTEITGIRERDWVTKDPIKNNAVLDDTSLWFLGVPANSELSTDSSLHY
jgi:hypothetical protein